MLAHGGHFAVHYHRCRRHAFWNNVADELWHGHFSQPDILESICHSAANLASADEQWGLQIVMHSEHAIVTVTSIRSCYCHNVPTTLEIRYDKGPHAKEKDPNMLCEMAGSTPSRECDISVQSAPIYITAIRIFLARIEAIGVVPTEIKVDNVLRQPAGQ